MTTAEKLFSNLNVSVLQDDKIDYPSIPPYNPDINYPEYIFKNNLSSKNMVYDLVRNSLKKLEMDKENFGRKTWNPFRELIKPGNTVVIKPNFVLSNHATGGDLFSIITHPSVIRAIVDYVYIALKGKGRIIIADAPQMDCNFTELLESTKLESIKELYKSEKKFNIEIYDLRNFWIDRSRISKEIKYSDRKKLPGDPIGGIKINLGKDSLFYGKSNENYYGADYNRDECKKHHHGDIQEYFVSKTIMSADVVISVPKLKTHKKVGVTLNAKGLVGINLNKNYLVHFTVGSSSDGGDEYLGGILNKKQEKKVKLQRWAIDKFLSKKTFFGDFLFKSSKKLGEIFLKPFGFKTGKSKMAFAGDWYGNDSAWRMAIDLIRIFIYSDKEGKLRKTPQRKMFSVVDGIIGGEGNGPLTPDSKKCGVIIAGFNFCVVDLVCARLMGFDIKKIKKLEYIEEHPEIFKVKTNDIILNSNKGFNDILNQKNRDVYWKFRSPFGWQGNIEI